ncbi:hypothetical protein T492DRAFT_950257 [Pavlovales sp. CCMP2436]|nr:hypothetical protein T492DRAFT_950257 [Pavlovales sp. CCMP2436]
MAALVTLCVAAAAMQGGARVAPLRGVRSHVTASAMGGHGAASKEPAVGFVQTEMRKAAMKLHTREQAPKEGEQKSQTPMKQWAPTRAGYMQFLVDSQVVYGAMEEIVSARPELSLLRSTGLERTTPLKLDIALLISEGCEAATPTAIATDYASMLKTLPTPAFVCHFYNYYFAHTAGGRMIGKQLSDALLEGRVLDFYKWDGDVKELLGAARKHIDDMAEAWTPEQRSECVEQTAASFKGAGSLMASLR